MNEVSEKRALTTPRSSFGKIFISEEEVTDSSNYIEKDVIKLIESFNTIYEDANILLDYLITPKYYENTGIVTSFEKLYKMMDDSRKFNLGEENNRGYLVFTLYKIWLKSRYYFYSHKPGVPQNGDGTNPDCYFLFDLN